MVPNSIKIPVPFEYVFPNGALFLGVDKLVDFDRLSEDDNQVRDEHGQRIWVVKVMDLDPEAGRYGRSMRTPVQLPASWRRVFEIFRLHNTTGVATGYTLTTSRIGQMVKAKWTTASASRPI